MNNSLNSKLKISILLFYTFVIQNLIKLILNVPMNDLYTISELKLYSSKYSLVYKFQTKRRKKTTKTQLWKQLEK